MVLCITFRNIALAAIIMAPIFAGSITLAASADTGARVRRAGCTFQVDAATGAQIIRCPKVTAR